MKRLLVVLLLLVPAVVLAETHVITWELPTGRCNTTEPLTNLALTRIYRATSRAALPQSVPPDEPCSSDPVDYAPYAGLLIAEVPAPTATYTDTTAPAGVVYYVAVAVDADGAASNPSNVAVSSRPLPPIGLSVR